jgi:exonuclease VII small subunit
LKTHRELYEEAKAAFEALIHAIDRGYVSLDE